MQNQLTVNIKEIFTSIQGEGLNVGQKQTFVRFCRCNLACKFCDTDFLDGEKYTISSLLSSLEKENSRIISLTGGEPLLETDFLAEFLPILKEKTNKKIYLETNGTLFNELEKVIDFVDTIAMDIKIKSATGQENRFLENEKFLNIAKKKDVFLKVVFDKNIEQNEIYEIVKIAKKYNIAIIIQPKMPMDSKIGLCEIFDKFYNQYENVRLIPQTHKFLNLA